LSSGLFLIGHHGRAARLARPALPLEPGRGGWYENVATADIALMRLDDARYVLNLAFSRKLDDPAMHSCLYALGFLQGDTNVMRHEMEWSVGKAGGEDAMLALQADTEAYSGHVQK